MCRSQPSMQQEAPTNRSMHQVVSIYAPQAMRPAPLPAEVPIAARRYQRESGYLLLAVLLLMALMIIAATIEAPRLVQQIKRDREEEMIHRGTEYARAVKKFYKKFGRYPANLEQLDNTNQIRFLRKRYNDPLTKDGKWKLLTFTDVQAILGVTGLGIPQPLAGGQGGAPGVVLQTTPAGA